MAVSIKRAFRAALDLAFGIEARHLVLPAQTSGILGKRILELWTVDVTPPMDEEGYPRDGSNWLKGKYERFFRRL